MASGTLERCSLHGWILVFHCTGQMADSVYGVVWVSGLLMSTLWIEWPMVEVGLWYGQAYVMDNEHRCILLMAFWMHRDTVTRSWGPLCHSSMTITSCCSMIMHSPMLQGSVHNSWKLKTSQFLHGQYTHRTCHPLSMFGMLWIGVYDSVFQFLPISSNFVQPLKRSEPTFHRPQSTTWSTLCKGDGKWWSHQILTGSWTPPDPPPHTEKLHILKWPFVVASLRHTCAIIMLSNQHLDMPHLWGGWIISAKEKCSLTQISTDLWTIFERNRPFVYIEKVLDLWVQLMKYGGKNKSVAFIFLFSVYIDFKGKVCGWSLAWSTTIMLDTRHYMVISRWLSCLFHGHLPSYRQVKTCIALCSAIFDRMGKNDSQLRLVSSSILPASNQTQRWNSVVRPHLFEWIIAFISIHYREGEREWCMCVTCMLRLRVSLYKQLGYFKNSDFTPHCWGM